MLYVTNSHADKDASFNVRYFVRTHGCRCGRNGFENIKRVFRSKSIKKKKNNR